MRVDFIIELKEVLIKNKILAVTDNEIDEIIKDIRMFLINADNFETNQ